MSRHLRPSSFLTLAMLRLQLSWTCWRRKRLARKQARLLQVQQLRETLRQERIKLAEDRAQPRTLVSPPLLPEPEPLFHPEVQQAVARELERQMQPTVVERMALAEAQETPPPPADQEIAQMLGLLPQPTSSPSSTS